MTNQAPGAEQRPKTPNQQGTNTPGSQDRKRSGQDQMQQPGRQDQPGSSERPDKPHDSDPGISQDKETDRGQSGA
jgi:hypothetical protein